MSESENTNKRIKSFTPKMQASLVLVFCVIILIFVLLAIRLFILFNKDGDRYQKNVLAQNTYVSSEIPYKRGDILDSKGTILATSERMYNLILDPRTVLSNEQAYRQPTVNALVNCFGFEAGDINRILEEKAEVRYWVIKKEVSYDEKVAFEDYTSNPDNGKVRGVTFEEQYKRIYPLGSLASDTIGYAYNGNTADWGVEGYYCDKLNGTNGRSYGYYDAELKISETVKEAVNGYNVVLTLDADVQRIVEKIVKEYMAGEEGADNVGVMIMNPNDGSIYAMYSVQDYDLNNPRDLTRYYDDEQLEAMSDEEKLDALSNIWRNFCVSDGYEPGSTFKPFTVAACLEEKTVGKDWAFICDGHEEVAGRLIHCVKREGHGELNLTESLMYSCNDVMMQISAALGRTDFYKYNKLFGIGSRTGVDLPGESLGLSFTEEQMNPQELATSSFGQGQTVTMIQMISGFSSLINGGYYYRPHIMKEIDNDAGLPVEVYEPLLIRRTVTEDTSAFIREALYKTVEEGTAKKAKAQGYKVAGKTGTAEKQPREDGNYVVSFMGYAPADAPEAVVYVIIDQPHVEDQTKCVSASLLASRIISEAFPVLGIFPTEPRVLEPAGEHVEVGADDIVLPEPSAGEDDHDDGSHDGDNIQSDDNSHNIDVAQDADRVINNDTTDHETDNDSTVSESENEYDQNDENEDESDEEEESNDFEESDESDDTNE